jgi:nucleoside 2-deoxyribosyltransferase
MKIGDTVYLCGPMTGWEYDDCNDWRIDAKKRLEASGYFVISPLRGKDYLQGHGPLVETNQQGPYSTNPAIKRRDKWDVERCDIILANLTGAKKASIGSCYEMAWGEEFNKFVLVALDEDNPHNHAFVLECASLVLPTYEECLQYLLNVANA